MKLNSLQALRGLKSVGSVSTIKPLTYKRVKIDKSRLSEIGLISYSSSLCLFASRILYNEIKIPNREGTLNAVIQEVSKLHSLLSKNDYIQNSDYTQKDTKKFFKEVGLKPKHISTNRTI